MSDETNLPIAAKKKALIGRQLRKSIGPHVSKTLGIPLEEVRFTDEILTTKLEGAFSKGLSANEVLVFQDRHEAVEFVINHCRDFSGPGAWLVEDFHLSGAIKVDLRLAIDRLDSLLRAEGEFVRLVSQDGKKGLCISSEEGKDDRCERHVVIWQ